MKKIIIYTMNSGFAFLLCCSIFELSAYREHYTQRRMKHMSRYIAPQETDLLWGIVGFFGAVTGVYALGSWLGWWGTISNEELIDRARKNLMALDSHQPLLRLLEQAQELHHIEHTVNESLLYQLALAKRQAGSIDQYVHALNGVISRLTKNQHELNKRTSELRSDQQHWYQVKQVHDHMHRLMKEIQISVSELQVLYDYLHMHRSYFNLFEIEDRFGLIYKRELELLEQYEYDEYGLVRALRSCVLSQYAGAFALIEYIKMLQQHLHELHQIVSYPAFNYALRIACARNLATRLHHIKELIVSDEEYIRLLTEYERAQRERERLRLEREYIRVKERNVLAKEREARALERQNRLREQQVYNRAVEW